MSVSRASGEHGVFTVIIRKNRIVKPFIYCAFDAPVKNRS